MNRNKAIEIVREYYPSSGKDLNEALETLIPELKESEDFESEWKRYCDSKGGGAATMNVKDVAKHFAQWQRERMMKRLQNSRFAIIKD